jgi:hypothetical protein
LQDEANKETRPGSAFEIRVTKSLHTAAFSGIGSGKPLFIWPDEFDSDTVWIRSIGPQEATNILENRDEWFPVIGK